MCLQRFDYIIWNGCGLAHKKKTVWLCLLKKNIPKQELPLNSEPNHSGLSKLITHAWWYPAWDGSWNKETMGRIMAPNPCIFFYKICHAWSRAEILHWDNMLFYIQFLVLNDEVTLSCHSVKYTLKYSFCTT